MRVIFFTYTRFYGWDNYISLESYFLTHLWSNHFAREKANFQNKQSQHKISQSKNNEVKAWRCWNRGKLILFYIILAIAKES